MSKKQLTKSSKKYLICGLLLTKRLSPGNGLFTSLEEPPTALNTQSVTIVWRREGAQRTKLNRNEI